MCARIVDAVVHVYAERKNTVVTPRIWRMGTAEPPMPDRCRRTRRSISRSFVSRSRNHATMDMPGPPSLSQRHLKNVNKIFRLPLSLFWAH